MDGGGDGLKVHTLREGVPLKHTKAYKGEGGVKNSSILSVGTF